MENHRIFGGNTFHQMCATKLKIRERVGAFGDPSIFQGWYINGWIGTMFFTEFDHGGDTTYSRSAAAGGMGAPCPWISPIIADEYRSGNLFTNDVIHLNGEDVTGGDGLVETIVGHDIIVSNFPLFTRDISLKCFDDVKGIDFIAENRLDKGKILVGTEYINSHMGCSPCHILEDKTEIGMSAAFHNDKCVFGGKWWTIGFPVFLKHVPVVFSQMGIKIGFKDIAIDVETSQVIVLFTFDFCDFVGGRKHREYITYSIRKSV